MKKNSEIFTTNIDKIVSDRISAKHGEFFFAKFILANEEMRESPVFVVSNDNDSEDVVVCSCTKQPARSEFDILVQLKLPTQVRTNKLYTIRRNQLLFKISQTANPEEYNKIIEKLKLALKLV